MNPATRRPLRDLESVVDDLAYAYDGVFSRAGSSWGSDPPTSPRPFAPDAEGA